MIDLAKALTQAFNDGHAIRLVPASEEELKQGSVAECHANAERAAARNGGARVKGWLRQSVGVYCRHSVVRRGTSLVEVTVPGDQWLFLPCAAIPDVDWEKGGEQFTDPEASASDSIFVSES